MRYLFIDRDGTLIEEPPDTQQIDSYEKLRLLPGVISTLKWAQQVGGYQLVMITNQDGLGTASFPEEAFWGPQRLLLDILASEGITWAGIHIDRSPAASPSFYRKPSPLLLLPYVTGAIDKERSFVIGDRVSDMELACRLRLRGLWLPNPLHQRTLPSAVAPFVQEVASWAEVQQVLERALFTTQVSRQTQETAVSLQLTLYGRGKMHITTGIGFLDHMLTLLGYHAGWDLTLEAKGDLHVDTHHTVEDVAIALGQALRNIQADKRGIHRYGQSAEASTPIWRALPMDESLALVAVDLSGRGYAHWEVALSEGVGSIAPALWKHFFETLAREGHFTLHLWARGAEGHHMVEALFKGLGRALREAFRRSYDQLTVPSTKGVL